MEQIDVLALLDIMILQALALPASIIVQHVQQLRHVSHVIQRLIV